MGVLVVHVVDDVHGPHVYAGEPVHHPLEAPDGVLAIEVLALHRAEGWGHLLVADLVVLELDGAGLDRDARDEVPEGLGEARSRSMSISRKVGVLPSDIPAPFCSFTAAR